MDRKSFWENVTVGGVGDCWEWKRHTNGRGYGRVWWRGKHRGNT